MLSGLLQLITTINVRAHQTEYPEMSKVYVAGGSRVYDATRLTMDMDYIMCGVGLDSTRERRWGRSLAVTRSLGINYNVGNNGGLGLYVSESSHCGSILSSREIKPPMQITSHLNPLGASITSCKNCLSHHSV